MEDFGVFSLPINARYTPYTRDLTVSLQLRYKMFSYGIQKLTECKREIVTVKELIAQPK